MTQAPELDIKVLGIKPNLCMIPQIHKRKKARLMSQTSLIVAHDPWFIQLLRIYPEEVGLGVAQAYDGQDVMPMVHRDLPVVILLEEDLPGKIKSWELLRDLRADPATRELPVLVFSWQGQGLTREMAAYPITRLQAPITYESFADALRNAGVVLPSDKHSQGWGDGQETARNDSIPGLNISKRRAHHPE